MRHSSASAPSINLKSREKKTLDLDDRRLGHQAVSARRAGGERTHDRGADRRRSVTRGSRPGENAVTRRTFGSSSRSEKNSTRFKHLRQKGGLGMDSRLRAVLPRKASFRSRVEVVPTSCGSRADLAPTSIRRRSDVDPTVMPARFDLCFFGVLTRQCSGWHARFSCSRGQPCGWDVARLRGRSVHMTPRAQMATRGPMSIST